MKLQNLSLTLGLAGLCVLQQVSSARALSYTTSNSAGTSSSGQGYFGQSFTPSIQGNAGTGTAPSSGNVFLNSFSFGGVNTASGIAGGYLYIFANQFTGTPEQLATSSYYAKSNLASGGVWTFSGNGVDLSVNSTYYAYEDGLIPSIGYSDTNPYSGGIIDGVGTAGENFSANTVAYANYDSNFTATYTASVTAVPWEFNPAQGVVLGLPLFLGLRILNKRKLRKLTASKATATVS